MNVGLIEACDAKSLFNLALWPKQRELLQQLDDGAQLVVWALGRRSGKSELSAITLLHACLLRDELDPFVQPGELRHSVAVATNLRQARLLVERAAMLVDGSPLLSGCVVGRTDDQLTFRSPSGALTAFTAMPASSRGVRGYSVPALALDESAHHVESEGPAAAESLWRATRPATLQYGRLARVVIASSPWGSSNWFHSMWQRANSGVLDDAVASQYPTIEVNPNISEDDLVSLEAEDPLGFGSEYLASFELSGDGLFDIASIPWEDRGPLEPEQVRGCVAGVDLGFIQDPTAVSIVGRRVDDDSLVLVACRNWGPVARAGRKSTVSRDQHRDRVIDEVVELCARYRVGTAVFDSHEAVRLAERLRERAINPRQINFGAVEQQQCFTDLAARVGDGTLSLYDAPGDGALPSLSQEMRSIRVSLTDKLSSPIVLPRTRGSHADMAVATALAVRHARLLRIRSGRNRRFVSGQVPLAPGLRPGQF